MVMECDGQNMISLERKNQVHYKLYRPSEHHLKFDHLFEVPRINLQPAFPAEHPH